MNLKELINRVRQYTRDDTSTLFATDDIKGFLNEAIDRIRHIPEFNNMEHLELETDVPNLLPTQYHYIIALHAVSRCYLQDEQNYPASVYSTEFSMRFEDLKREISNGTITIVDGEGMPVITSVPNDYVVNEYFKPFYRTKMIESGDIDG